MTDKTIEKRYLGDAVYASVDERGMIMLTTENGIRASNRIYIEPSVAIELVAYIQDAYPALNLPPRHKSESDTNESDTNSLDI